MRTPRFVVRHFGVLHAVETLGSHPSSNTSWKVSSTAIGLLKRPNCSATLSSCPPSGGFTSASTVRMPYIFGEACRAQLRHVRVVEPVTARLCNSEQPETPGSDVDVLIIGS